MSENPLTALLTIAALSARDFGVMEHGFAAHGRDYRFLIQDALCRAPGTYELTFTHVVDLRYETRIHERNWALSWKDEFTDIARWTAAGSPAGYIFGTNWSLAHPGIGLIDKPEARDWSNRLQRPMHAASLETDRFYLSLVFSEVRHQKISYDLDVIRQVLVALPSLEKPEENP